MPQTSRLQQISFAFSQADLSRFMALFCTPRTRASQLDLLQTLAAGMMMVNWSRDQFQMQRTARQSTLSVFTFGSCTTKTVSP